jgi:adenylosuccinate synthase
MNIAVIGIGFGDEGKGCTVDWLCDHYHKDGASVIRYSGGHQAGHNVVANDVQHVFSNFGSGTIRGCKTYWEGQCMIDPIAIHNEYKKLVGEGLSPKLFIDRRSPVTTPLERHINRTDGLTKRHGTCGNGIRATQFREECYFSITAIDLLYPEILKEKYRLASTELYGMVLDDVIVDEFMGACNWLADHTICKRDIIIGDFDYTANEVYIYESSQGLLLDKNIGFFPNVTPSNVGMRHFKEANVDIDDCYYVTRAYQTRHGNGYMTDKGGAEFNASIKDSVNDTNPTNEFQGPFKRTMLDLDMLEYALVKDGMHKHPTLVITCLEHMTEFKFHYKGTIFESNDSKQFCEDVCRILGITRYVMCSDHKFSKILYL